MNSKAEDIYEAQASGMFADEGVAFSDYRWVDEGFRLGQLRGNHFEVLLRPPRMGWGQNEAVKTVAASRGVSAADAFRRLRDEVSEIGLPHTGLCHHFLLVKQDGPGSGAISLRSPPPPGCPHEACTTPCCIVVR